MNTNDNIILGVIELMEFESRSASNTKPVLTHRSASNTKPSERAASNTKPIVANRSASNTKPVNSKRSASNTKPFTTITTLSETANQTIIDVLTKYENKEVERIAIVTHGEQASDRITKQSRAIWECFVQNGIDKSSVYERHIIEGNTEIIEILRD